jgi:excisionase family DNA binding protein
MCSLNATKLLPQFTDWHEKSTRSPLMTVRQVSEWLNVSPSWVRDHATNRRRPAWPSLKFGKRFAIHEDQVAEWIIPPKPLTPHCLGSSRLRI